MSRAQPLPTHALSPDEPIDGGLIRLALGHVDAAVGALAPGATADAVHEARKSTKRARAVLALVGGDRVPAGRVRDAARALAPLRDADVLRALADRHRLEAPPPVEAPIRAAAAAAALDHLAEARRSLPTARLSSSVEELWASVARSWRRARRAERQEADLHELRKASKRVLHQLEVVAELRPGTRPLAAALEALQEDLGDHHDLVLLSGLTAAPELHLDRSERRLRAQARVALAASSSALLRWLRVDAR